MSTAMQINPGTRAAVIRLHRLIYHIRGHWILAFSVVVGVYTELPWLAPVFMHLGWTDAGNAIYAMYSTQCHQLPQRSFFLYCPRPSHSLAEIQSAWQNTDNPLILRQFEGNSQFG